MTEEYAIPTKTNKVHVIREGIIVTRAEVLVRQFLKGSSVVVNIPTHIMELVNINETATQLRNK